MADSRLDVVISGTDELSPQLKRVESSVIRMVGAISASLAAIKIGAAPIIAAARFEREMANVGKTTDFFSRAAVGGIDKLDQLGDALLKMSLRMNVSAVDLAKIAAQAGQQGLGTKGVDGIVKFTDTVSRMASVLDISAEEAAVNLGKIVNIFKVGQNDFERVSSTINEVSNSTTANGKELLDVVKRIGDATGALTRVQATALAATGLDFGMSPEVIGTAYTKIFSAMQSEAEKFAKITKGLSLKTGEELTGDSKQWLRVVATDGYEAYQAYLAGLRRLEADSRQTAIKKLTGGGRQGQLVNKQVGDTTNSVMRRAMDASERGDLGLSSIKESTRVLDTLVPQMEMLGNSIAKAGIDASKGFLPELAKMARELNSFIQTKEMQSFLKAIIGGVGNVVISFAELTKKISELNVNWENFITPLKALFFLKMAETIGKLVASMSFFGTSLKSIASNAELAARAHENLLAKETAAAAGGAVAAATTKRNWVARALGVDIYLDRLAAAKAAESSLNAIKPVAAAAQATAVTTNKKLQVQQTHAASSDSGVGAATAVVAKQQAALLAAQQASAAEQLRIETLKNSKLAASAQTHTAAMAKIQTDYEAKYAVINATGTQTGLKALRAARAVQIVEEEAHHARSIKGTEQYYAKQTAIQSAALAVFIDKEAKALAARQVMLDTALVTSAGVAASGAALTTQAAAATAAATATAAAAKKAADNLDTAKKAVMGFGAVLGVVGTALVSFGRILLSSFNVLFLVYIIADLAGLLKYLPAAWDAVTRAMGLNSKATRDAKIAREEAIQKIKEEREELERLFIAYQKNIDLKTGKPSVGAVDAAVDQTTSDDPLQQERGRNELVDIATATAGKIKASGELARKAYADNTKEILDELDKRNAAVKQKQDELAKYAERSGLVPDGTFGKQQSGLGKQAANNIAIMVKQIVAMQEEVEKTRGKLDALKGNAAGAAKELVDANEHMRVIGEKTAGLFTPDSLQNLKSQLIPIAEAREEVDKLVNKYKEITQNKEGVAALSAANLAIEEGKIATANALYQDRLKSFAEVVRIIKEIPGIPQNVLGSYITLQSLLSLSAKDMRTMAGTQIGVLPGLQTGALKVVPPTKPQGTETVDFKRQGSGESKKDKEHKLALARLALEKAQLEALNRQRDEADQQALASLDESYDKGLLSTKKYYAAKLQIQQNAIDNDIASKQQELKSLDLEIARAEAAVKKSKGDKSKQAELLQLQARRATQAGDITVLEAKKPARKVATDREKGADDEALVRSTLERRISVRVDLGVEDFEQDFQDQLQLAELELKETIARMEANIGTNGITQELIDKTKLTARFKAVESAGTKAFDAIGRKTQSADDALSHYMVRLNILQRQGKLTEREAETLSNRARAKLAVQVASEIKEMTTQLEALRAKSAEFASNPVYINLAEQLEKAKDKFLELRDAADATAEAINSSVEASIQEALMAFGKKDEVAARQGKEAEERAKKVAQPGYKTDETPFTADREKSGNARVLEDFRQSIADTIKAAFAKDLTQSFIKNFLGGGGTGGIGGFVSKLLNPFAPETRDKETIGLTEANAMYVELTSASKKALGLLGADGKQVPGLPTTETMSDKIFGLFKPKKTEESAQGSFRKSELLADKGEKNPLVAASMTLADGFSTGLDALLAGLKGDFTGMLKGLGTLFEGLFGGGGGAGGGGFMGLIASLFHTGGVVGGRAGVQRVVPAQLFAGARRYHQGTMPGLKPDEVPAILQKGEEVLTKNNQSVVAAAMAGNKGNGKPAGPSAVTLSLHPETMNYTMRDWFERELSRINSTR